MEKSVISNGAANAAENNVATSKAAVNPLAGKVVTEKKATEAKQAKDKTAAKGTQAKGKGKATPKAKQPAEKKASKPKLSVKIDELIKKGGKWEDLIAEANKFCKEQGLKTVVNVASFKTQVYWRTKIQKNPDYLGNMELTEKGIFKAKAKKAA